MSFSLTVGYVHLLASGAPAVERECSCEEARKGCSPTYVFSVIGQVAFRNTLHHLTTCHKQPCRRLRARVLAGMSAKLSWLLQEESLLGCVLVQPYLFGRQRVILHSRHFPAVAHHLAQCPKESCAQLRRALLLTVREKVRPVPMLSEPI